jgi:hypothetical protein
MWESGLGQHTLLERFMTAGARLQSRAQSSHDGIAIPSVRGAPDAIGGVVKSESALAEARRARAHVSTHLTHLRRVAQARSSLLDRVKIVAGQREHDVLHGPQVLAHVLLLVIGHVWQERQWRAGV